MMKSTFKGKSILVTGGTGSIGSEIVREVLKSQPRVVRALSNDENGLFALQRQLQEHPNVRFLLGDVRDKERMIRAMEGIDIVFHAAALKHVPMCEYNPFDAVSTNVIGTQNVIAAAIEQEVERFVAISTDKAVNPSSVMGATKLLAERLTMSASLYMGSRGTVFCCVRFGNVLGSRGSVLPVFRSQVARGGPVTITDPTMTRFVMSIPRAAELVLRATEMAQGNEVFILKMPSVRLSELAQAAIEVLAPMYGQDCRSINVIVTGKREAEKDHEELLTADEAPHAYETADMIIIGQPGVPKDKKAVPLKGVYASNEGKHLSKAAIRKMLIENLSRIGENDF